MNRPITQYEIDAEIYLGEQIDYMEEEITGELNSLTLERDMLIVAVS